MADIRIEMNDDAWDEVVKSAVEKVCTPMMENVAAACNSDSGLTGSSEKGKDQDPGYRAGTQGSKKLNKGNDFRATAITATYQAMHDNAANNRLVNNFYLAGGAK